MSSSEPLDDRSRYIDELVKSRNALGKFSCLVGAAVLVAAPGASAAAGYRAAESPFAPSKQLLTPPLLPQSALLNSLPLDNELIADLQAYVESFRVLLDPVPITQAQITRTDSLLWKNLRINAQRAAGMFIYNREQLLPKNFTSESPFQQNEREEVGQLFLEEMRRDVLLLVNASGRSSVSGSLRYMRYALNGLCNVAYLLVDPSNYTAPIANAKIGAQLAGVERSAGERLDLQQSRYSSFPVLTGRVSVILEFVRPNDKGGYSNIIPQNRLRRVAADGKTVLDNLGRPPVQDKDKDDLSVSLSNASTTIDATKPTSVYAKLILDGVNHPISAGAFLSQLKRGNYRNLKCQIEPLQYGRDGERVNRKVFGDIGGESEPYSKKQLRRLPVEVLRETLVEDRGGFERIRYTATGAARNSEVFTQNAPPVLSFATYGAVGLWHDQKDVNGGSPAFFTVPFARDIRIGDRDRGDTMQRLNNKYSLFAFCVDGNDVLLNLKEGDVLVRAEVERGVYSLNKMQTIRDFEHLYL